MRITVVGSGHGVPEPHRKCTCFMVEIGEKIYFVDMGTPGIDALVDRNLKPENVEAIFITHKHGDHADGLLSFMDLISWYYKTANPEIHLPDMKMVDAINGWLDVTMASFKREVTYKKIEVGEIFNDGVLKVTAIATKHCPDSHAFLFEADGKRVLFSGDLKKPEIDFPYVDGPIDLLFCEAAHFYPTEYLPVFEKLDLKRVSVNHYSDTFLPSALELKKALAEKGLPVILATDDMIFTV